MTDYNRNHMLYLLYCLCPMQLISSIKIFGVCFLLMNYSVTAIAWQAYRLLWLRRPRTPQYMIDCYNIGCLNINMSCQYRYFPYTDNTISLPCYLLNGSPCSWKPYYPKAFRLGWGPGCLDHLDQAREGLAWYRSTGIISIAQFFGKTMAMAMAMGITILISNVFLTMW